MIVAFVQVLAMTDVTQQEEDTDSPFYGHREENSHLAPEENGPGPHGETLSEGTIRRLRMSPSLANPELLE